MRLTRHHGAREEEASIRIRHDLDDAFDDEWHVSVYAPRTSMSNTFDNVSDAAWEFSLNLGALLGAGFKPDD